MCGLKLPFLRWLWPSEIWMPEDDQSIIASLFFFFGYSLFIKKAKRGEFTTKKQSINQSKNYNGKRKTVQIRATLRKLRLSAHYLLNVSNFLWSSCQVLYAIFGYNDIIFNSDAAKLKVLSQLFFIEKFALLFVFESVL